MLSKETISCILEGIYINSGCGKDKLLDLVTKFFDVYEEIIVNPILQDPDFKVVKEKYGKILIQDAIIEKPRQT